MPDKTDGEKRVKEFSQELVDSAHRVWLAGLGALSVAEEEGGRLFRDLVERGRELEGRGRAAGGAARRAGERMRSRGREVGDALDARIGEVLARVGMPSRDEIQDLTRRVEELNAKIDRLGTASAPPPAPPRRAAKRPASGAGKREG